MNQEEENNRYIELSWKLLEYKCRYYMWGNSIPDAEYDALEAEYIKLADQLELPKSASNMVGFSLDRPSCRLVYENLKRRYSKS